MMSNLKKVHENECEDLKQLMNTQFDRENKLRYATEKQLIDMIN